MDREDFISTVELLAGVPGEGAEGATRAVLQTLGERISEAEARDLAAELPPELAAWVFSDHAGQSFDVDEFLRRVAEREGVDEATAERHVRAVLAALAENLSDEEFANVVAQLPMDFAFLLPRGPDVEPVPPNVLRDRVAERAGLDAESAGRAIEVVLETLAERIAPGEVDDLIALLPVPLHEPLRRGKARNPGTAQRMPLERFVARVAEREGVTPDQARAHARAVLTALHAAVGDEEFSDVTVQLPPEYAALWLDRG
jgi:uncharacterized protein (DUF2267 family)